MEIKTSVPAVVYDIYPYGGAQLVHLERDAALADDGVGHELRRDDDGREPRDRTRPASTSSRSRTARRSRCSRRTNITAGGGVAAATKNVARHVHDQQRSDDPHHAGARQRRGVDLSGSIVQSNYAASACGASTSAWSQNNPPTWRIVGAVDGHDAHVRSRRVGRADDAEGRAARRVRRARRVPRQRRRTINTRSISPRTGPAATATRRTSRSRRSKALGTTTSPSATSRRTTASAGRRRSTSSRPRSS